MDQQQKKKQAAKKAALKKQLLAAWQSVGQEYTSQYSIAILNADGQEVSYTTTDSTFSTASIVKVSIAAQLLHNNGTTQTTLSTTQANLLTAMIENSDNDAATSLLTNDLGGYSSLSSTYQALDMNDTTANADAWGYTQTTAEDQIKLLSTIFGTADYLTTNSQDYLQSLMNTISADQAWCISQGATNYYLKNGWLQDEDGWMVNSIGKVELGDDESYLIAILTKENTTFEEGQTLIEALTEQKNSVLSSSDK
ncbi:MAG: serine hydrolase [Enterococcus italicus]